MVPLQVVLRVPSPAPNISRLSHPLGMESGSFRIAPSTDFHRAIPMHCPRPLRGGGGARSAGGVGLTRRDFRVSPAGGFPLLPGPPQRRPKAFLCSLSLTQQNPTGFLELLPRTFGVQAPVLTNHRTSRQSIPPMALLTTIHCTGNSLGEKSGLVSGAPGFYDEKRQKTPTLVGEQSHCLSCSGSHAWEPLASPNTCPAESRCVRNRAGTLRRPFHFPPNCRRSRPRGPYRWSPWLWSGPGTWRGSFSSPAGRRYQPRSRPSPSRPGGRGRWGRSLRSRPHTGLRSGRGGSPLPSGPGERSSCR